MEKDGLRMEQAVPSQGSEANWYGAAEFTSDPEVKRMPNTCRLGNIMHRQRVPLRGPWTYANLSLHTVLSSEKHSSTNLRAYRFKHSSN